MLVRQFWAYKSWRNFSVFPRYLAYLFNRAFLIFTFFFQHSRWMGDPGKLHSKKRLVTVLTLVWHVTSVTISGRGNIPSKLWAWKETAWMVSKTHSILATSEVQKSQHFSLGNRLVEVPSYPTTITERHTLRWKWPSFSGSTTQAAEMKWLSGAGSSCRENKAKHYCWNIWK